LLSGGLGYIFSDNYEAASFFWVFPVAVGGIGGVLFLFFWTVSYRYCVIYNRWLFVLFAFGSTAYFCVFIANFGFFLHASTNFVGMAYFFLSACLMFYWLIDGFIKYNNIIYNLKNKIIKEINKNSNYVLLSEQVFKDSISKLPLGYHRMVYVFLAVFFGSICFFGDNGFRMVRDEAKLFVMMVLSFPFCHFFLKSLSWGVCCFIFSVKVARETGCTPYITE